ncbi:MAG: glycosyltransferase [Burkholderiales bacterium]
MAHVWSGFAMSAMCGSRQNGARPHDALLRYPVPKSKQVLEDGRPGAADKRTGFRSGKQMRVALAWELGGGMGHVDRLAPWAGQLAQRDARVTAIVADLPVASARLPLAPDALLQAPVLRHGALAVGLGRHSYAELLLAAGYGNPATLEALVRGWLSALHLAKADLVLADHAPTALLAARISGLPAVQIGDGFTIPPAGSVAFGKEAERELARYAAAEERVTSTIHRVQRDYASPPLARLAALQEVEQTLLLTYPELDHYQGAERACGYAGAPVATMPEASETLMHGQAENSRPSVFAYLKPMHAQFAAAVNALAGLKVPVTVYAGGAPAPSGAGHLDWRLQPLDVGAAIGAATLVVCHAGHGLVCQALLAGRPLLLLPGSYEQLLTAYNVAALGAGAWIHPEAVGSQVRKGLVRSLADADLTRNAGSFARAHQRTAGQLTAWLAECTDRICALAAGRGSR